MRIRVAILPAILLSLAMLACSSGNSKKEAATSTSTPGLAIGDSIPATGVMMEGVDGAMYSLGEIQGDKGTLVIFTCNHCPYVKAWQGRLVPLANDFFEQGVGVIAINSNDPEAYPDDNLAGMVQRAQKMDMHYPYVVDISSDVARAFGATHTPEAFLFSSDGKLVYHGAVDDNAQNPNKVEHSYLRDALTALVEGGKIGTPVTKSIGCSIKYRKPVELKDKKR